MTLEISSNRRTEIKFKVIETLEQYSTPVLPIKIGSIIRNIPYIKLITYSSQIKKHRISYDELIVNAETKDSYVVHENSTGRFCIYYNDIDVHIMSSNRVRWNLAHELGHVILNHHKIAGLDTLRRTGIDDSTYNYLEKEADYFAQLLLVPHAALLGFRIENSNHIKIMCKISDPASRKRYYEYVNWRSHINAKDEYDNKIFHYYYNFIYKHQCTNCKAKLVQRYGKYCPICGQKTLQWGDGSMIYKKLDTDDFGKLKECPICENEETNIAGNHCQICGTYLVNNCTSDNCEYSTTELPSNARYCPICGSKSTFYRNGFLKEWNFKEQISSGFMSVPDGIDDELPFS